MAFALCLSVSAADMVVKGKNGEDQKINVVDTSETFLRFKILSDSTVELTDESSCRGHESITIPEKVRIEGKVYTVTSIGYSAFRECRSLTNIKIPKSVTSIGYKAFYGCSSLTSINIPEGLTSIEYGAFSGCKSLTSIKIPEGVTSIGYHAFEYCRSLTSIIIPEGVTSIGGSAFYGCDNLEPKLLIYDKGTKCYGWIGNKEKCTDVVIPKGMTSIGAGAFAECSGLTSIKIPEGVTSIGESAFGGCSNLDIVIDNSEEKVEVGWDAFKNCKSVKWLKD